MHAIKFKSSLKGLHSFLGTSSTKCKSRAFSSPYSTNFSGKLEGTLSSQGPIEGAYASCEHIFTQEAVNCFAALCGDNNPLHVNPEYASKTLFNGTIVHGILVSSLFSTLLGRSLHGAIYVNQNLKFRAPVHVGSLVRAKITVLKNETKKKGYLLTCNTEVQVSANESVIRAVDGEAVCLLPYAAASKYIKL